MEFNRWKSILVDWVSKCNSYWKHLNHNYLEFQIINTNFLTPSFSVIEETNLEAFFREYRSKVKNSVIVEEQVFDFLRNTFPNFSFHHFDDDGICSADYIFVYSLLLYYGSVQSREVHIQNSCKHFNGYQQTVVASFFKQLSNFKNAMVTRGNLKKMIVEANKSDTLSASPLNTPNKKTGRSPQTPKNRLMEQNMRKLNKVKIQLETERFEKGFLEIQIKDGEQEIQRLNEQQKLHMDEIHELKSQLLYDNIENRTPNMKQESTKKGVNSLKRDINQLEDKVANLLAEVHCLNSDKTTLNKKLKHSEEQMKLSLEKTQEISSMMQELKSEAEVCVKL